MSSGSDDTLKYPICLEIALNAVESACCHQVFCEGHAASGRCPCCRREGVAYVPSFVARRIIDGMPATCPDACGTTGLTVGRMTAHQEECLAAKFRCPASFCSWEGPRRDFGAHLVGTHPKQLFSGAGRLFAPLPAPARLSEPGARASSSAAAPASLAAAAQTQAAPGHTLSRAPLLAPARFQPPMAAASGASSSSSSSSAAGSIVGAPVRGSSSAASVAGSAAVSRAATSSGTSFSAWAAARSNVASAAAAAAAARSATTAAAAAAPAGRALSAGAGSTSAGSGFTFRAAASAGAGSASAGSFRAAAEAVPVPVRPSSASSSSSIGALPGMANSRSGSGWGAGSLGALRTASTGAPGSFAAAAVPAAAPVPVIWPSSTELSAPPAPSRSAAAYSSSSSSSSAQSSAWSSSLSSSSSAVPQVKRPMVLRFRDAKGNGAKVRLDHMQKLKHAFDVVAAMWKRSLGDMRFLYDGSMLGGDSSPRSMGMDWHGADTVHQIDVSFPSGRLAQTA